MVWSDDYLARSFAEQVPFMTNLIGLHANLGVFEIYRLKGFAVF